MDALKLFFVLIAFVTVLRWIRSDRSITLRADRFWQLVRSQEKPIVLLTTRGFLIKRLCYVYPYQGVLFITDAKQTEAPDGVTLIGTGDSFSIP